MTEVVRDPHTAYLEKAYNEDIPISYTVYTAAGPQLVGQRPIPFSSLLYYIYQQQKFFREVRLNYTKNKISVSHHDPNKGATPQASSEYANSSSSPHSYDPGEGEPNRCMLLSDYLYEKLKFAVGDALPYTTDLSLLPELHDGESSGLSGGGGSEGDSNAVNLKEKNALYRRECQEELLKYIFDDETQEGEKVNLGKRELLYGMRQVFHDSPQYFTEIQAWHDHNTAEGRTTPTFLVNLLKGVQLKSKPATEGYERYKVTGYNYRPLLKTATPSNVTEVLDSTVPPRQLQFYLLDHARCKREYDRRRGHLRRMAELTAEIERNVQEGKEHLNSALQRERAAEEEALSGSAAGEEEGEENGVGVVQCFVERADVVLNSRESILNLESVLNNDLHDSCARGWRHLARDFPGHSRSTPGSATLGKDQATYATTKNGASTTKGKGKKLEPITATPAVKKNRPTEINAERTIIQLYLLSEELTRQVTVDLPERGVLFRHIINEAFLSLEARRVLAEENIKEWMKTEICEEDLLSPQELLAQLQSHVGEGGPKTKSPILLEYEKQQLEEQIAELKMKHKEVERKKAAMEKHYAEAAAATRLKHKREKEFQTEICNRLREHAERVKDAQDRERRTSLPG